jgi:hypothetical protein
MKRSEMEYKIAEQIQNSIGCDYITAQSVGLSILSLIEDLGMLPPLNRKLDWAIAFSEVSLHEWEQE